MGYGKKDTQSPAGVYRDDPDYADMASAVLLDDVDFPDDELPSYEDTPLQSTQLPTPAPQTALFDGESRVPPELAFSTQDLYTTEIRTRFPLFSTDSTQLYQMIKSQARYPPSLYVQIYGSHTETRRNGNKETKDKVVDFIVRVNLTRLLGKIGSGEVELLPDNKRGYRGTILPRLKPTVGDALDEEAGRMDELRLWCEKYVQDPAKVKSFLLKRRIINHDQKKLEYLLRSAISETNYRGHVGISFPTMYDQLIVYSPGKINEWRITVWIRWVFYCTFMWLFAWPLLFFLTARYSVVKVIFPYADIQDSNNPERRPTVMSEVEWFHLWESAIKRAALARMQCKDGALDEAYRVATEQADRRGQQQGDRPMPSTGNSFADGAIGLLGQGLRVAGQFSEARGWGADC